MLKATIVLGGVALAVAFASSRVLQHIAAWLVALLVALTLAAIDFLPLLAPMLPKLFPAGLLAAVADLLHGRPQ